jgi:DNA polymerase III subunit delta
MITFLYGTDTYRIKQRVNELTTKSEWERFDVSEQDDFVCFAQSIKTVGLFADQTNYVITEAFATSKLLTLLQDYKLESDKDRTVIVVARGTKTELQKRNKELFAYLNSKKNTVEIITPLDDNDLAKWVIKFAKSQGSALTSQVARALIERITNTDRMNKKANNDRSFRLAMEIQKLKSYKLKAISSEITERDLDTLVIPTINNNIFAITDAVANKNRGQATKQIHQSLHDGLDPYFIHSMLVYQFRNMLTIKSIHNQSRALIMNREAITKLTGLHPYVVQKTINAVRNFEMSELKTKFASLQQLEIDTKSGTIDLTDGLYQFVFQLV